MALFALNGKPGPALNKGETTEHTDYTERENTVAGACEQPVGAEPPGFFLFR